MQRIQAQVTDANKRACWGTRIKEIEAEMSRTQKNKVTAFAHTHWVTADTTARHSRGAVPLADKAQRHSRLASLPKVLPGALLGRRCCSAGWLGQSHARPCWY